MKELRCPRCETHIWNYVYDTVKKGGIASADFTAAEYPPPKFRDKMACPHCHAGGKEWMRAMILRSVPREELPR